MARVAFLLGPQFEDSEMQKPYVAMREAGHETAVIGLKAGERLEGKKGEAYYETELAIQHSGQCGSAERPYAYQLSAFAG
jgi:protease I